MGQKAVLPSERRRQKAVLPSQRRTAVPPKRGGSSAANNMTIKLIKGVGLRNVEMIGRQDPYVKFKLGTTQFKSKTHNRGGKNPEWGGQEFKFPIDEQKMRGWVLLLQCYDAETFKDRIIGEARVPLQTLFANANRGPIAYRIENSRKFAGEIFLSIEYKRMVQATVAPSYAPPPASVYTQVVQPVQAARPAVPSAQPVYAQPQTAQPVYASQAAPPPVYAAAPVGGAVYGGQPAQPVYAAQPAQPVYGAQPAQPVYGGQPARPVAVGAQPVYGGQPAQPVYAAQPAQPVYGGQPARPVYGGVYGGQPAQPVYGGQPARPVYGGQPAQPVYGGQPAQPVYGGQPARPVVVGAQPVYPTAQPVVQTAQVVAPAQPQSIELYGAKTAINGTYDVVGKEDGVNLYRRRGSNFYCMRHTDGKTVAWWITEWRNGNKRNTTDFYFCKAGGATPPVQGWRVDKHCKGKMPPPKLRFKAAAPQQARGAIPRTASTRI